MFIAVRPYHKEQILVIYGVVQYNYSGLASRAKQKIQLHRTHDAINLFYQVIAKKGMIELLSICLLSLKWWLRDFVMEINWTLWCVCWISSIFLETYFDGGQIEQRINSFDNLQNIHVIKIGLPIIFRKPIPNRSSKQDFGI